MKANELEYRMYGLVPYNLSPIQQGIQFGHAVQEYNNSIIDNGAMPHILEPFDKWRVKDKTFIILNGGTTNWKDGVDGGFKGSLNKHYYTLVDNGIHTAYFNEPDLGDQLTAVVFLVDERVWNKEKYPDFVPTNGLIGDITMQRGYKEWVETLGGETNVWLREFLRQFKLA